MKSRKTIWLDDDEENGRRALAYLSLMSHGMSYCVRELICDLLDEAGIEDPSVLGKDGAKKVFEERERFTVPKLLTTLLEQGKGLTETRTEAKVEKGERAAKGGGAYVNEELAGMLGAFGGTWE